MKTLFYWLILLATGYAFAGAADSLLRSVLRTGERFKDSQIVVLRDAAGIPASLDKAVAGVGTADPSRVHVGVEPLSGPSLPCKRHCFQDQIARALGAFIAEHGAVYASLVIAADELSPDEQGARIGGQQNHLLTRPNEQQRPSPVPVRLETIMPVENVQRCRVRVFHFHPGRLGYQERLNGHRFYYAQQHGPRNARAALLETLNHTPAGWDQWLS